MKVKLTNGRSGNVFTDNNDKIIFDNDGVTVVNLDDNSVYYATVDDIIFPVPTIKIEAIDVWTFEHNRSAILESQNLLKSASMNQLRAFIKKYKVKTVDVISMRHITKSQLRSVVLKISEVDLFLSNNY